MSITLTELLASRDARVEHQKELAEKYPRASLICFTVMLPGSVKRDWRSLLIADAGVVAIRQSFSGRTVGPQAGKIMADGHSDPQSAPEGPIMYQETRDLETGFEAYFVVDLMSIDVKRLCCSIEDEHPLGRLMDIDVIVEGRPLSREDIGLPARHCLLCDKPARECMRAHRHSPEEIQDTIDRMVQDYNSR